MLPARLTLDGRRKSIEPVAVRLGGEVHYQTLHHVRARLAVARRAIRRPLATLLVAALEPVA